MHATDARKGSAAGRYRLESQEDGVSHKRMMLIGISATTIQNFAIALAFVFFIRLFNYYGFVSHCLRFYRWADVLFILENALCD